MDRRGAAEAAGVSALPGRQADHRGGAAGTGDGGGGTGEEGRVEADPPTRPPSLVPSPREVKFSNLDKVFWPEEGYTKGDLIEYYRAVSPWLLPYLKDR